MEKFLRSNINQVTLMNADQNNVAVKSQEKIKLRTFSEWYCKYFLDGQTLSEDNVTDVSLTSRFDEFVFGRYRKFFALLVPFLIAQMIWGIAAVRYDYFSLYPTYWEMPVTMIFGAMIGGMTSEGGGAVAFPVMTFVLHLSPTIARDFSVMIQTVGLSTAMLVIVLMRVQAEWRAVIFGSLGALPGVVFGLHLVDPLMAPAVKKMVFVSVWGSFGISLWILNSERKRVTFAVIPRFSAWHAIVIVITGAVGGVFTAFAGSGVDICVFSTLTLLFRVTEKTATPTTVTLMALTSQFCFYWRVVVMGGVSQLAYDYLKVCASVVVTFAPIGSFLGSHFHRQTLAVLIYVLEAASYIGFLLAGPGWLLIGISLAILSFGYVFFTQMGRAGQRLLHKSLTETEAKSMTVPSDVDDVKARIDSIKIAA